VAQIASGAIGLSNEKMRFEWGDAKYPKAPVQGKSMTVASVAKC
jgi:hypothetical protein